MTLLANPTKWLAVLLAIFLFGCNPDKPNDTNQDSDNDTPDVVELPAPSYTPKANEAVIYYKRADHLLENGRVNRDAYSGWGLHLWEDDRVSVQGELATGAAVWDTPFAASGIDTNYGAIFVIPFNTDTWHDFMFIMHNGGDKDIGGLDWLYDRSELGQTIFLFEGVGKIYTSPLLEPPLEVSGASAHWLDATTMAYNPSDAGNSIKLYQSLDANLEISVGDINTIAGGQASTLTTKTLPTSLASLFPHLASWSAWEVSLTTQQAKSALKGQLWLAEENADGEVVKATLVQTPGVLDDLYADNASSVNLGALYTSAVTTFSVWAPTAQTVSLELTTTTGTSTIAMVEDATTGVWSVDVTEDLNEAFYRFELAVYHPETDSIEQVTVTDPYSLSLSTNSEKSQVVDLNAASLLPTDWSTSDVAVTYNPEDISVYEAHIRDFSVNDNAGTAALNGKYGAFTEGARESVQHLLDLQAAGLTHIHLLPTFDIATINEVASERVELSDLMSDLCAADTNVAAAYTTECASADTIAQVMAAMDSTTGDVQELNGYLRNLDGFNWGYDPYHYTVPEGSYATDPEGTARILEFREMIKTLHDQDLMVVMDVVYNHTNASGLSSKSVLDKVVPGYYHRRNATSGAVETSTCCANTASEHRMFEKLMIDSLKVWAEDYKIDAFRFDLMGHHMKSNMENALAAVQAVRPHVYFYGEGWDFGEVGQSARGANASQTNMAGTGIGTFTDRLRDAVRGGGPFDDGETIRANQGFGNAPLANELNTVAAEFEDTLLEDMDIIRVGLAGNLKTFSFEDRTGATVTGVDVDYNGSPTAYADDPQEVINYVSKHDNQTLWDNNMYKMPSSLTSAERARLQALSLSIPMLSQGVPFIHMGSELLRSKSMARDSYDSGDWFNAVHFDGTSNNWNIGLPRENVDGANWELIGDIIADVNSAPTTADIALTNNQFQDWLKIRYSSDLFRLHTATEVNDVVSFHNTGAGQTPGVIVMKLTDTVADIDATNDAIIVIFNATNSSQAMSVSGATGFALHPVLAASPDTVVQSASVTGSTFTVPALTTAVFVK